MKALSLIFIILTVIGAVNWGLVGAFNFDLVATIFGFMPVLSRIIYLLVGISGVGLLFVTKHMFVSYRHDLERAK